MAALGVRVLGLVPEYVRRHALSSAFDRARDAFNRGDLEAVFALFAADVEYGPPPPLHDDGPLLDREAVFAFWRDVQARYETSSIENLSIVESAPGRFVRRARLRHLPRGDGGGEELDYVIEQTTELRHGRVVRQINVLAR